MKLVVQVKLLPAPAQAEALAATLRACNEAAVWVSEVAFGTGARRNFDLRKHTYTEVKSRWGLGAQAAQHVIKKVCDAYRTLAANAKAGNLGRPASKRYRRATEKPVVFRPFGAQPFDDRMLSWQIPERTVSVWTVSGRLKDVAFTASPEHIATLALFRRGESDLVHRGGMWFLQATCEVPETPLDNFVPTGSGTATTRRPSARTLKWYESATFSSRTIRTCRSTMTCGSLAGRGQGGWPTPFPSTTSTTGRSPSIAAAPRRRRPASPGVDAEWAATLLRNYGVLQNMLHRPGVRPRFPREARAGQPRRPP